MNYQSADGYMMYALSVKSHYELPDNIDGMVDITYDANNLKPTKTTQYIIVQNNANTPSNKQEQILSGIKKKWWSASGSPFTTEVGLSAQDAAQKWTTK